MSDVDKIGENKMDIEIDELTNIAATNCMDIFNDFSEEEIKVQPLSVQNAWKTGKTVGEKIKNYYKNRNEIPKSFACNKSGGKNKCQNHNTQSKSVQQEEEGKQ